jgi:hypothetical protein
MVTTNDYFLTGSLEEGSLLDASYKRFAAEEKVPRTAYNSVPNQIGNSTTFPSRPAV